LRIGPDKIQLNTVVRPPAEKFAAPLSYSELESIRDFFGDTCEIIAPFENPIEAQRARHRDAHEILAMVTRRPMTAEDLATSLGKSSAEILSLIRILQTDNKLKKTGHKGKDYYEPKEKKS